MRNQEWDSALAQLHPLYFCQLIFRFFSRNSVDGETAFGIVNQAEVLPSLLNGDDIHETGWIGGIGSNFAVDFNEALHHDRFGFAGIEGILQSGKCGKSYY